MPCRDGGSPTPMVPKSHHVAVEAILEEILIGQHAHHLPLNLRTDLLARYVGEVRKYPSMSNDRAVSAYIACLEEERRPR